MMGEGAVALAAIALVGSILALVVKPLFALLRDNTKQTAKLSLHMDLVAKTNERIALATEKGNRESEKRNGHLGDQNIQITDLIANQNRDVVAIGKSNADILKVLKDDQKSLVKSNQVIADELIEHQGGDQTVNEQFVEHQTVGAKK